MSWRHLSISGVSQLLLTRFGPNFFLPKYFLAFDLNSLYPKFFGLNYSDPKLFLDLNFFTLKFFGLNVSGPNFFGPKILWIQNLLTFILLPRIFLVGGHGARDNLPRDNVPRDNVPQDNLPRDNPPCRQSAPGDNMPRRRPAPETTYPETTCPKTICLQDNVPRRQPAPEIICPGKQIVPEDTLHRTKQDNIGISRNKLGLRLAKLKLF